MSKPRAIIGGLQQALRNTGSAVSLIRDAQHRPLKRVLLIIEGDAKKFCPKDTGRLRNSITHKINPQGAQAVSGEVGVFGVGYGAFVEFGTGVRGKQGQGMYDALGQGGDVPSEYVHGDKAGMAPRPYLRPAVDNNLKRMNDEYADELKKVVGAVGIAKG